jgi:hypothetical protein
MIGKKRKLRSTPAIRSTPAMNSLMLVVLLAASASLSTSTPSRCVGFTAVPSLQRRKRGASIPRDLRCRLQQQPQQPLVPEENPDFDSTAVSLAGVPYAGVRDAISRLFPPEELEARNAQSRTDGYWPFVRRGEDPPADLTYGEFDLYFFSRLLDRAASIRREGGHPQEEGWKDKVFVDIGSGTGRLVLSAAALHPGLRLCRGVELLPTIHEQAVKNLEACRVAGEGASHALDSLPLAPVELVCGSMDDPYVYFGDADVIFVFSSCMTAPVLSGLAAAVGRQCRPGTLVITTEYMLPLEGSVPPVERDGRFPSGFYRLGLVEKVNGWCWLTGGSSTAYVHRVESSLWTPHQGPVERPEPTAEDTAFEVAMALEAGTLTDPKRFLRGVRNNMVFHGFPDSFLPKLDGD